MSRKKHRPARPHWERIASRKANGVNEVITPTARCYTWWGTVTTIKRENRPANAKPGV